jgi:hypothetical protein
MPRKKSPAAPTKAPAAKINKSAFVRSLPRSMPAKEVVAKAKAQGITISVPLVYIARAQAKKKTGKRGPGRPRKNAAIAASTSVSTAGVEGLLRAAAAEIGLSRAIEILNEQRESVRRVLGG